MHFLGNLTLEREVVNGPLQLADGRTLPEGAFVGSSGLTVHFDKKVFGADAEKFNPERWLQSPGESAEAYAKRLHAMRSADMSWGRGSRGCLGKSKYSLCKYCDRRLIIFVQTSQLQKCISCSLRCVACSIWSLWIRTGSGRSRRDFSEPRVIWISLSGGDKARVWHRYHCHEIDFCRSHRLFWLIVHDGHVLNM